MMSNEIRCPACGELNPADAEVCQKCQAVLSIPPKDDGDLAWLLNLRRKDEEIQPPTEETQASTPGPEEPPNEEEIPEWLQRVRLRNQYEQSAQEGEHSENEFAAEEPFYEQPDQTPADTDSESDDWFEQLRFAGLVGSESHSEPETTPVNPSPEPPPNWEDMFKEDDSAETPPLEPGANEESFLSDMPSTEVSSETVQSTDNNGLQGWLSQLDDAASQENPPDEPEGIIPDWLQEAETPASIQPRAVPPSGEIDLGDWLSSLDNEPTSKSTQPEQPLEETSIPDWLSSLQGEELPAEEPPAEPAAEPGQPLEETSIPDWLSGLQGEPPVEENPAEPAAEAEQPLEEAGIPDWLDNLGGEEETVEEQPAESEQPFSEGEIPDWLQISGGETPALPPADISLPQPVTPFREDEFNAWLTSTLSEKEETPSPGENLAPSQLPGWLQAMRPVDGEQPPVSAPPAKVERIETGGPLAGVSGALPGENLVLHYRKPPAYSNRVHVSEKQQVNAALLEEALSAPPTKTVAGALLSPASNRMARWLIVILLLCAALLPLIGNPAVSPGWLVPSETSALLTQIDRLPAGSTALVVVEYDPSLAGEMRLASHLVFTRLLQQQVNLAILSTSPSSLILTEAMIDSARAESSLSNDTQVANLGYLAGGITAVQQFVSAPQTAAPYLFTTGWETPQFAWVQPALKNIQQLSDFSALILLTGSVENGRTWIEQAQPAMQQKPFLMIASAQAAPMLQPYLHSGQAQGMSSGLVGSFALETLTGIPSARSAAYRDAYQYALSAAMLLILLGSLAGLAAPLFKRRSTPKG